MWQFLEKLNFDVDHHQQARTKRTKTMEQEKRTAFEEEDPMESENNIAENLTLVLLCFSNPPRKNLCFSNAAASCLLNIPSFKNFLLGYTNVNENITPLTEELFNLTRISNYCKASTQRLRSIVQMKCLEAGQITKTFDDDRQHDSSEFLQSLMEHFWKEHMYRHNTLREDLFGGISQDILTCFCGNRLDLSPQNMSEIIPIQIIGRSIQNGLADIFQAEEINWKCPKCHSPTVEKRMVIIQEPSTLILQLMRFSFDAARKTALKLQKHMHCPKSLQMPSGTSYSLNSVVNHNGEKTNSGHYNIILYDKENDNCVLLDDSLISILSDDQEMNDLSYIFIYTRDAEDK